MKPYRVCEEQKSTDDEVQVLHPAAWPHRQRTDRERCETVVFSEQAVHDSDHGEEKRAGDACSGQCGDHRAASVQGVGGSFCHLSHLHVPVHPTEVSAPIVAKAARMALLLRTPSWRSSQNPPSNTTSLDQCSAVDSR